MPTLSKLEQELLRRFVEDEITTRDVMDKLHFKHYSQFYIWATKGLKRLVNHEKTKPKN